VPASRSRRKNGRENVVDLMEALRRSVGKEAAPALAKAPKKSGKKSRKASAGQKEMLMSIVGKNPAREAGAKKTTTKQQRKSA
jgi:DNA end-binding protein Ku